jgi:hypothetical protein
MTPNRPAAHVVQLLLPLVIVALGALPFSVRAPLSVQQQTVTVMAAGDISPDPNVAKADDIATSDLVLAADPTAVLTLGDHQYPQGELADYQSPTGYQGSWGRFKAKTRPSPGNTTTPIRPEGRPATSAASVPWLVIPTRATTPLTSVPGTSSR